MRAIGAVVAALAEQASGIPGQGATNVAVHP
jgi:hypothetical protein